LLPSNSSTANYFRADKFEMMKHRAYFYNLGRGATVDQDCLARRLVSGNLAGAYLDVMTPEPLPSEHPLWSVPNCLITPHTAGGFDREMMGLADHFLANLSRFVAGEPLLNQVI
jgi:phosphoglycerate dehydrogenase-like enzyme